MRYAAAALQQAASPVVFSIGGASARRGFRRLSRWWVQRYRTWRARPISTEQMLALQAARRDPIRYVVTLAVTLRAILPHRWWYRLTGDPVALILRLGAVAPSLQTKVLQAFVTVPGSDRDQTVMDEDETEALRRWQRRAVYGDEAARGPQPTLAIAALSVRCALGESWYYAPARWRTSDGYAPFAVTWLTFVGLQAIEARQQIALANGYAVANAKDPGRVLRQLEQMAYPQEVC